MQQIAGPSDNPSADSSLGGVNFASDLELVDSAEEEGLEQSSAEISLDDTEVQMLEAFSQVDEQECK